MTTDDPNQPAAAAPSNPEPQAEQPEAKKPETASANGSSLRPPISQHLLRRHRRLDQRKSTTGGI